MYTLFDFKLPEKLDKNTRKIIEDSYIESIKSIGEIEYDYINKKIQNKIVNNIDASIDWIPKLSLYYKKMYNAFNDHFNIHKSFSEYGIKCVGAALFYYVNPFDIIPDYTPVIGYLDDYYVFFLCIETINDNDKQILKKYFI